MVDVPEVALKFSVVFGQLSFNSGEGSLDVARVSLSFGEVSFDLGEVGSDGVDLFCHPLQRMIEDFSDRHGVGTAWESILQGLAMDIVRRAVCTYDELLVGRLVWHSDRVTEKAYRLKWLFHGLEKSIIALIMEVDLPTGC